MKHQDVAKLMARLFSTEPMARSALITSGFPPEVLPQFTTAAAFWSEVINLIEMGIGSEEILPNLLEYTAEMFPGNADAQALHAKYGRGEAAVAAEPAGKIKFDEPCATFTLAGVDLPDEFLQIVREQLGSTVPDLLYVTNQQCAVAVPDLGDNAARIQQQIQELIQTYAPGTKIQVAYGKYSFRPYLFSQLTVFGPDTTPYSLQSVPATMTPRDIAAAIVAETRAMSDGQGGPISTVIDAETEGGSKRLDMDLTLHENDVKDADKLRVGTKAVAGNISPELRMEAQLRMRAQIRRYAFGRSNFEIIDYDNEDLPNRITFELEGPGFAPPEDLKDFLAGTEQLTVEDLRALAWEQLRPVRIDHHKFTMHLPPMFPVVAPYVIWNTPVFHPNIWRETAIGARPGTVCLGPLMSGYRPDLDFGYLCQLLVDIGTYQNYDVVDADTYPDPDAAFWARTQAGQQMIIELGGPPMRPKTERADEKRPPGGLFLTPLADMPNESKQ